ncbi:Zn-dependent protease with chaperone function [Pseudoduganella flava]|uniref:M48 family metalloprotease n=1 Tax=Pseudoduganella flava TaxID=871742 RepID=A0A562PHZ9_9BURK|nr:M48 family metallopeptidase [Pseudoduganella flava]QGZ37592.1 M48 family metalloprotease [Pseudoduganella flava]TWI44047.1 Zn-dependent protease with chaperone function [Pseudoduganella flava]
MDPQQYTRLVRRLELDSHADPAAFRRRVMLVSLGAYAVIVGTLALCVLLVGLAVRFALAAYLNAGVVKFALLGAVFVVLPLVALALVLRTLFTRLAPPHGRPLTRDEAPALFDMLDRMRAKLGGPGIDHVLIDDRYNAAIAQLPRFGLFGWHANYLTIGLPYLLGVPMKEMLATVAHEYGHICGNHGKFGAWVYRQRQVFVALYGQVREQADDNLFQRAVAAVLDRLMPYYNAYTFVLSRQNEYDADRTASALVGTVANAQGLVRDALQSRWMAEEFWPTLLRHAERDARPPFMPFAAMKTAFKAGYEQWARPQVLAAALAVRSSPHDTHPCLRERVDATGEKAALPRPVDRPAADVLLPPELLRTLIRTFDDAWWEREGRHWEARHRQASRARLRLTELSARPLAELALGDLQELALLRIELVGPAAGKDVLAYLLAQPGGPFPKAAYHYGCILLGEGDDEGLFHLEAAVAHDRSLADAACDAGHAFLLRTRGERAAQLWMNGLLPRAA